MHQLRYARPTRRFLCLLIALGAIVSATSSQVPALARPALQPTATQAGQASSQAAPADGPFKVHIPISTYTWRSPFGYQATTSITGGTLLIRTIGMRAVHARLGQISWKAVQPNEGDPYNWAALAGFERELRVLKNAGITPEVIVGGSPRWATKPYATSCGPISSDKFGAFANFMRALASRYSTPEFNVYRWELGNEVDVDPKLVPADNVFGCWGDIKDPYYGGRQYGEMLKVVTPAIKAANPAAEVWIGGLLLDTPNTTNPAFGKPEQFLAGILEVGAAPYFDAVPYHWYPSYGNQKVDYDFGNRWEAYGGGSAGKARFLRQIMQRYGVNKPLYLNEVSFSCPNDTYDTYAWCVNPAPQFFSLQADMLVRVAVRSIVEGVSGFYWYTLNAPGWRHGSLLQSDGAPKPAYNAYNQLSSQLNGAVYAGPATYTAGVEGYSFRRGQQLIQVLWAKQNQSLTISLPAGKFVAAYDRFGNPKSPVASGAQYQLTIPFETVYLVRRP
jgi:hypothetical protein